MSDINPDGSLLTDRNGFPLPVHRYSWQAQIPPITPDEFHPQTSKARLSSSEGDGSGLGSPLQGLPPRPPVFLPPSSQLGQTLSAGHFFHQYQLQQRFSATPTHNSFLFQSHPQGLNPTFPYPHQTENAVQHGPSYGSSNTSLQYQGQNGFPNRLHHPTHQQHHFKDNPSQNSWQAAAVAREISNPAPAQGQGILPSFHARPVQRLSHREGNPVQEAIQHAAGFAVHLPTGTEEAPDMSMVVSEARDVPLPLIDNGSNQPGEARKRGRPKLPTTDGQPKRRRKKKTGEIGGWSRGMKIGPRQAINPGAEFNALYAQATEAFVDEQDSDKALDLVSKAIAINPEIYSAHALQAEILFSQGEDERAIDTLYVGAHAIPTDPEVWFQAANAYLERSTLSRNDVLHRANYCLSAIISTNSAAHRHTEARFQRAAVNRAMTNYSRAMRDLEDILKTMPRESSVLRQYAEICIDIGDISTAKKKYEDILDYYKENGFQEEESFTWADILVYSQILALEDPPDVAISNALKELKRLSRWLLGREDEAYWDDCTEDDREFDSEDEPRRILVPQFVPGTHLPDAYGAGLPLEIRVRLGILRLTHSDRALDEALAHFEWLDPEARDEGAGIHEYPDLFLEVAQVLHEAKEYDQALRYFEALKDTNAYSHTDFWLGIGASAYMCGDKLKALECYEEARIGDDKSVEARTQLSKLFADYGDKEMAMESAREAIRLAESLLPDTGKRPYEPKDLRLSREEAEKALKEAFKLLGDYSGGIPVERIESKLQMVGRGKHRKRLPKQLPTGTKTAEPDHADKVEGEIGGDEDLPQSNERVTARLIVRKVAQHRQDRPPPRFDAAPPKYEFRVKRPSAKERDARRTDTINGLYQSLLESTDDMRAGDENARRTWMGCADTLLKDFRSNRTFYSDDRITKVSGLAREALLDERKKWQERQESTQAEEQEVDPDIPIPSVESTLPTEYREIAFSDWLDIFLEYAMLLSQDSDPHAQTRCYSIIDATLGCIVWKRDSRILLQIYITYLSCAMALKDEDTLYNVILRWFLKTYEFDNDAYRLFAAINLVYPHTVDKTGREGQMKNAMFCSRGMHQLILKQLLVMDSSLPEDYNPPEYGPVPKFMRKGGRADELSARSKDDLTATPAFETTRSRSATGETPEHQDQTPAPREHTIDLTDSTRTPSEHIAAPADQERQELFPQATHSRAISQKREVRPAANVTELNVLILLLYGQILNAAGTLSPALSYFLRAQSLDPRNPVILLSISLAYMHHIFLKKCDNRHMMLLQGWAFFEEYVDARREWAQRRVQEREEKQDDGLDLDGLETFVEREIEFNRARCLHMLGMNDLAVRSYEKVLSMAVAAAEENDPKNTDFTMDAAYAISTIYALGGNMEIARKVTEEHLVV